jgi:thiamine biosynthesis lipoprotein
MRLPRPRALIALLVAIALGVAAASARRPAHGPVTVLSGPTMGTRYAVTIGAALDPHARDQALAAVGRELARVDAVMSNWRADSEVERLNRSPTTSPIAVSRELAEVVAIAEHVSDLSAGAFDITVAPVVRAWGFGSSREVLAQPNDEALARAAAAVGYRLLDLAPAQGLLTKRRPDTTCDLSGVAPGYAADRIASALAALGHADVLVDIGGEIKALGHRPGGAPWRVAVSAPPTGNGRDATWAPGVGATVALSGLALATSGDYRDFRVDHDGQRLTHLIDPRTARPVRHALASATVVHPSAANADALATAMMVLGPEGALALADRQHLAAYFILRKADGSFEPRQTREFAALRAD